ncbi:TPA: hypothetical protein DDZ75_04490 [Patescibacteria group bacterium]|nr:hypothetical protein [Patescibacteria group bacterium]
MSLEEIIELAKELFEKNDELKNDEELIYSAVGNWLSRPLYFIKGFEGLSPLNMFEQQKEEELIKWLRKMNWKEGAGFQRKNRDLTPIKLL